MIRDYFIDFMEIWACDNERFSAKGDIVINRERLSSHNNCIVICNTQHILKHKEPLHLNVRKKLSKYAEEAILTQFYLLNNKAAFSTLEDFEKLLVHASHVIDQYRKKITKEKIAINGFLLFSNNNRQNPEYTLYTFGDPHITFLDEKSKTNSLHMDVTETGISNKKIFHKKECVLSKYHFKIYPLIILSAETEWLDIPLELFYQLWWEDENVVLSRIQDFIDENALHNTLPVAIMKLSKKNYLDKNGFIPNILRTIVLKVVNLFK